MLPENQGRRPSKAHSSEDTSRAVSQKQALRQVVEAQIKRQQHFLQTADLIDRIIERYPDCPRFASTMVDRLLAGDESLAAALQNEEF